MVLSLPPNELRAYDAPFPTKHYKAGSRIFPSLIPTTAENVASVDCLKAWDVLEQWHKPFLTAFSDGDLATKGYDTYIQNRIPGAKGMPHITLKGWHFIQEDSGVEFASAVNRLLEAM